MGSSSRLWRSFFVSEILDSSKRFSGAVVNVQAEIDLLGNKDEAVYMKSLTFFATIRLSVKDCPLLPQPNILNTAPKTLLVPGSEH